MKKLLMIFAMTLFMCIPAYADELEINESSTGNYYYVKEAKDVIFIGKKVDDTRYVSAKKGLNLRLGPSTDHDISGGLAYADEVRVIARSIKKDDPWVLIDVAGEKKFLNSDYIQIDKIEKPVAYVEKSSAGNSVETALNTPSANGMTYMGSYQITAYEWTGSPCANGNYPSVGYTVACNSLPMGTQVYIDGIGYRTVEDRGATWHSSAWIDLYLGDPGACENWGIQYLDVWVVN